MKRKIRYDLQIIQRNQEIDHQKVSFIKGELMGHSEKKRIGSDIQVGSQGEKRDLGRTATFWYPKSRPNLSQPL